MRRTLKAPVTFEGVGLHSGRSVAVTLRPAPAETGYAVVFSDGVFPVQSAAREGDGRGTVLSFAGRRLMTVEHLLSSLRGLGVDDLFIEPQGIEIPLLDGSGRDYCEALVSVGFMDNSGDPCPLVIDQPLAVQSHDGRKVVLALPCDRLRLSYVIDYEDTPIGVQMATVEPTVETYIDDLAQCRTFCLEREVAAMRSVGLGLGGSLESALVVGDDGPLGGAQLRRPDEYVRHKMFDMLGDLALIGRPVVGHFIGLRAGHAMHLKLVERLLRSGEGHPSSRRQGDVTDVRY